MILHRICLLLRPAKCKGLTKTDGLVQGSALILPSVYQLDNDYGLLRTTATQGCIRVETFSLDGSTLMVHGPDLFPISFSGQQQEQLRRLYPTSPEGRAWTENKALHYTQFRGCFIINGKAPPPCLLDKFLTICNLFFFIHPGWLIL